MLVALAAPAGAHTQVQEATPGPGAVVAAPVDEVVLDFLDPLLEAPQVLVATPDGTPVAGLEPAELTADDVARATFTPLTEPGAYQVTYVYASLDGAPQEGSHQFRVEAPEDGGFELRPALAAVVGVAVLGLVAWALAER